MKTLSVAFIGPPNAGKSHTLNQLCETKLLPESPKVQTSFRPLSLIYQEENLQVLCFDTPGWVRGTSLLDQKIREMILETIKTVDLVISNVPPPEWIKHSKIIIQDFRDFEKLKEIFRDYAMDVDYEPYNKEDYSLHPAQAFFLDNVRALLLNTFNQELPYQLALQMRGTEGQTVYLDIIVGRNSQKPIVLSKMGKLRRSINSILHRTFGPGFVVELFVRVEEDWWKSERKLREFGYA